MSVHMLADHSTLACSCCRCGNTEQVTLTMGHRPENYLCKYCLTASSRPSMESAYSSNTYVDQRQDAELAELMSWKMGLAHTPHLWQLKPESGPISPARSGAASSDRSASDRCTGGHPIPHVVYASMHYVQPSTVMQPSQQQHAYEQIAARIRDETERGHFKQDADSHLSTADAKQINDSTFETPHDHQYYPEAMEE